MASKYEWKFNCWTGNYTANLPGRIRLLRTGHDTPCPNSGITFLYRAEDWNVHPAIYGPWERTPAKALRELKKETSSSVESP